jgi:hypothetical protein
VKIEKSPGGAVRLVPVHEDGTVPSVQFML